MLPPPEVESRGEGGIEGSGLLVKINKEEAAAAAALVSSHWLSLLLPAIHALYKKPPPSIPRSSLLLPFETILVAVCIHMVCSICIDIN